MDNSTVYSDDFEVIEEKTEEEKEPKKKLYKPFGIVSMVFGILSLASFVASSTLPLSILYPFVGLIFASFDLKRNRERTKFGKVGYITSVVALIIEIILITLLLVATCALVVLFIFTLGEI